VTAPNVVMPPTRHRWRGIAARAAVALAVAAVLALVVHDQGADLRRELGRLSLANAAAALALGLAGVAMSLLSWRSALAALGARLPLRACAEVFFPSQLGKYLPGSVWPLVAQVQLGQRFGVARTRMAAGSLLALGLSVVVASLMGAVLLPVLAGHGDADRVVAVAVVVVVVVGLAFLHPRILGPVLDRALRLLRRDPVGTPDGREIVRAVAASALSWLLFGAHVAVLAHGLGGSGRAVLIALFGMPLASAAGVIVVIAPAGAGVRETILVLLLRGRLGVEAATALVLLSRGLLTVADVLAAACGGLLRLAHRGGSRPPTGAPELSPTHDPDG
jgi:hypothetical protein